MADRLDEPGTRAHRLLSLFDGPDGVAVDYALRHTGRGAPGVGFDPRLARRLRTIIGQIHPAVVVAHGGEPLKYLVPATVGRRTPLVYYAIGTVPEHVHRPVRRALWRVLVRRADVVACEGPEVLSECRALLRVPEARSVLAPNCRDPERFRPTDTGVRSPSPEAGPAPMVTFLGALTAGKRPRLFVDVVAAARAKGVEGGPELDGLAAPAAAAGVELVGWRRDVVGTLQATDLMLFPSLPHGEGMPGVLIEAGMCGVPVVATDAPGVRTIVVDGTTGVVVDVDDFEALVASTVALLEDHATRRSMGLAAHEYCVRSFSLDTVAHRWLEFLLPLLGPRHAAPRG
jgi:glycosyltransferase involved in cell wall biosynthesis